MISPVQSAIIPVIGLVFILNRYIVRGLVAILLSYGTYLLFRGQIELATSGIVFLQNSQVALGVIFGVAIGLGGSLVSVGRHLRNV